MNKIRSLLALLLCACMLFALCACGGETNNNENENETKEKDALTTPSPDTEPEEVAILTVKVVDADGNAVEGAMIQLCNEVNCFTSNSDSEGCAKFLETVVPEITSACYLSVPYIPEGYEYTGEEKVYLEDGASEYTVTLTKVG